MNPHKKNIRASFDGGLSKIFTYVFGGVGTLLLVIAAILFYVDQQAVNRYVKTSGKVIKLRYSEGAASPVISYTWEGNDLIYFSNTYSNPPSFNRGEVVDLYVNPNDPKDVLIDNFIERFLAMIILGGIGSFFLGFILVFNYLWNNPRALSKYGTIVLLALISLSTHAQNSLSSTNNLVIATYQYADNPRIKNIEPFAFSLKDQSGINVEVKSFKTVQELLKALEREEVDIAFMNTFGYMMLREKSQAYEICAALSIPETLQNSYKSVMVVNKALPVNSLNDVITNASEFVLMLVSEGSTSGNLIPRLKLASMQPGFPERFFLEVMYTNNHKTTLQQAFGSDFALCAFGSNEYYALGADTLQLKKLWESPAIPLGPIVYRKSLSGSIKDDIQKSLLTLHEKNVNALEQIKAGWTEFKSADRFKVVTDDYYNSLWQLSGNKEVALYIIKKFSN